MLRIMHTITMFLKIMVSVTLFLLLSGCNENDPSLNSKIEAGSNSILITQDDITKCKELTLEYFEKSDYKGISEPVPYAAAYDVDFDGHDEIVVMSAIIRKQIFIYKIKENGMPEMLGITGFGQIEYLDDLKLYTYVDENNKYVFFKFHYNSGGVMDCDVISALIKTDNEFVIQHLFSWGTNTYDIDGSTLIKSFFREGWDKTDVSMYSDSHLTEAEFNEKCGKYLDIINNNIQ